MDLSTVLANSQSSRKKGYDKNQPDLSFQWDLIKGIALAATAAVMWALLSFALKRGFLSASPQTLSWFRLSSSGLGLLVFYFMHPKRRSFVTQFRWVQHLKLPVLLAAFGLAFNYVGYAIGLQYTSPGNAQMFIQAGPFLTTLFAFLLGIERSHPYSVGGFIIAVTGFATFYKDQMHIFVSNLSDLRKGSLWILAASASWAMWALLQKQYTKKHHLSPWDLNLLIWLICSFSLVPWASPKEILLFNDLNGIFLLFFLACNTLIAYGAYTLAYLYAPTSVVNLVVSLNPLFVFCLSPDQVGLTGWLGGLLVLAGLFVTLWPEWRKIFSR